MDLSFFANPDHEQTFTSSALFYSSETTDEIETSCLVGAASPQATGTSPFDPAADEKGNELPAKEGAFGRGGLRPCRARQ